MRARRLAATFFGVLFALAATGIASADGEAGLVIQEGDEVLTYCIPFSGNGIEGDDLLLAAGQTFDVYGGGSGLALCSIGDRGCQDAGSFSSCFCQCQGGDCTYWAFFTREHGAGWVYSARAFNLLRAGDGDVHGWKWGKGGANSAPAPQDITFEQICGHAPRGGVAQLATAPPNLAPTPTVTIAAVTSATPARTASPGPSASTSPSSTPLVTLPGTAALTPVPPDLASLRPGDDGPGSNLSLVAFAVVAFALVAAIAAAAIWRNRHGA